MITIPIAYSQDGLTGRYLTGLFQRLGLTDELKSKTRSGRGAEMVGDGEAEIGITQISEILPVAGVELAGPLPAELQQYTVFPAAIAAASRQAEAAKAVLDFLGCPDAARVHEGERPGAGELTLCSRPAMSGVPGRLPGETDRDGLGDSLPHA